MGLTEAAGEAAVELAGAVPWPTGATGAAGAATALSDGAAADGAASDGAAS